MTERENLERGTDEYAPVQRVVSYQHCDWAQDGDECSDTWGTDCGHMFCLEDGDPFDNAMVFCCYCGRRISVTPLVWNGEEVVIGETKYRDR